MKLPIGYTVQQNCPNCGKLAKGKVVSALRADFTCEHCQHHWVQSLNEGKKKRFDGEALKSLMLKNPYLKIKDQ